ncbi:hypothetical protein [Kocuria sp. SM24M-10]|uniref:hypothetical protein n=1 Tax=Kocuria sp. SM24M-10 TaxID=1660349 RepID=UPI001939F6A3|nr:hypothetical protein [Kocuria sp. SM24M-10]
MRGVEAQIQARERISAALPMKLQKPARATRDYIRHWTSTMFAALGIAIEHVTAACKPWHRRQEFLAFLKQAARAYSDQ